MIFENGIERGEQKTEGQEQTGFLCLCSVALILKSGRSSWTCSRGLSTSYQTTENRFDISVCVRCMDYLELLGIF